MLPQPVVTIAVRHLWNLKEKECFKLFLHFLDVPDAPWLLGLPTSPVLACFSMLQYWGWLLVPDGKGLAGMCATLTSGHTTFLSLVTSASYGLTEMLFVSLCLEIGINSVWTKRDSSLSELLLRLFKGKSIGFCCEPITGVPVRKKTWRKLPHFGWRGDLSAYQLCRLRHYIV